MATNPFMSTDDLVASIKRRIMFPISQNTFSYADIVAIINEELHLNAVPSIKEAHEEYFVYKDKPVPLVNGISRYPIPSRAIGMALRDVNWSDSSGSFFKMTRIAPEDKEFFQQNVGSNQAIGKYYLEGNEIVLTPQISTGATGNLNFFIFLRPNYLVRNDRAANIVAFQKTLTISNNSLMSAGDKVVIITGPQTSNPNTFTLTAVTGAPGANQFQIGVDAPTTANNLSNAISALNIRGVTVSTLTNVVTVNYPDIASAFNITSNGITVDNNNIYILFDNLPTTYTDPDTNVTTNLYQVNTTVDFLQKNPGHRTYTYDISLQGISGNVGKFAVSDLQTYQNNSSGGQLTFFPIKVNDYICLSNECIIPQIPPELHVALAERAAAHILKAIGDMNGYQASQARIAEMDRQQATLIDSRVEGSVPKVFNSFSLLRMGKRTNRRRV